ncbi:MAG: DUF3857 domain-containing protein, partial [Gemmataceae bacterium]|nr:DUF3857 domain-containing protein [Gemmataceae bacterium]
MSCLLAAVALCAAPAAEWPVARGPSREPDPYAFSPKAVEALPKAVLENSTAVVLYAGSTQRAEEDGTLEITTHEVTRLGGRKAIEKLGEARNLTFTPSYQKLTLHLARIHKPGGKIADVEPRHCHLRDVPTDYSSYDADKQLVISFPGLEVGDVIELKWTVRGKNPEHGGHFFARYQFGDPTYPVILDELKVLLAKGREVKHLARRGTLGPRVDERQTVKDGYAYHRWQAKDCPKPPQDENLPSKEELRSFITVSTFKTWEELGAWKHKLRAPCLACTPALKKLAAEITAGLKTPLEKARALTYWVRRNVRYVAAGEKHDYTPHPPEAVLATRFGDCKDSSNLLAVMLREVGVKVELVTLGTQDDGQIEPDVPSPWGTHAILAATIGGKLHWIDTTARLNGWDELPRDDLGRQCYLLDEKGKARLVKTPPATAEMQRAEVETDVWIDDDGGTRNKRRQRFHGLAAIAQRERHVEVPDGERKKAVTAILQDSYSRARLVSLSIDEASLKDHDKPALLSMEYDVPKHFSGSSEKEAGLADNWTWSRFLAYNIDHSREAAMVLPGPFWSRHTYRVRLPIGWEWDNVPKPKSHKSKWGLFKLGVTEASAGKPWLELSFETLILKPRIEVEELDAYREFYDEVQKDYRAWLTMKPVAGLKHAPALEKLLAIAPMNAQAAKTLAKAYLNAERKADARRVLEQAREYMPDDEAFWDLSVDAAETPDQEVAVRRELAKRHPGEGKHQLGLASALISAGQHPEARKLLARLCAEGTKSERGKAHYNLARSHYRRDEHAQALAELDKAQKADLAMRSDIRALRLRGQVLDEMGRPNDSLRIYRAAYDLDRGNREILKHILRLAVAAKDEMVALDYLRRYALRVQDDLEGLVEAAEYYHKLGRLDEATELALRARDLGFHERAQRLLGLIHYKRGDFARASLHLDRAEPDALVHAALLRSRLLSGDLSEVADQLDAIGRLRDAPEALRRLAAQAQDVLGRRQEAEAMTPPTGERE